MNPQMAYAMADEAYNAGELVLSIRQGESVGADGVCRALTWQWAKARKKNAPWAGRLPTQPGLYFPPSPLAKKFPGLNHMLAISPEIRALQDATERDMSRQLGVKTITEDAGSTLQSPTLIFDAARRVCLENYGVAILGISNYSKGLVAAAPRNPVAPPARHLAGAWQGAVPQAHPGKRQALIGHSAPMDGHALGFVMSGTRNEFFDANTGWYNFASYQRFSQFFVRYISGAGYRASLPGPWELWSIANT